MDYIEHVKAVYPVEARPIQSSFYKGVRSEGGVKTNPKEMSEITDGEDVTPILRAAERWDPPVSLAHLSSDQQAKVKQLLRGEYGALSKDDNNVSCIPSLQLKIWLNDNIPIKWTSIPRPLHTGKGVSRRFIEPRVDQEIQVSIRIANSVCTKKRWESKALL